MKLFPSARLAACALAACGVALGAIFAPPLVGVLAIGGAALAAIALFDLAQLAAAPPPEVARALPARALVRRPARLALVVRSRAARSLAIEVVDELPRDVAPTDPHAGPLHLAPDAEIEIEVDVVPTVRGLRELGAPVVLVHSPLGLWTRRVEGARGALLDVGPDTTKLPRSEALDARRALAALGIRPVRKRGEGSDFEALREYVPGDDPRHVDWKATARRGRLMTRLHRHERSHRVVIAVDASRLMAAACGDRTKLDWAVDAALALAYTALVHGDRVGVALFDESVRGFVAPRAHRGALGALQRALAHAQPRLVEADHAELVRALGARQRQRALVVVLTDFVEADAPRFQAPLVALARRHRALLVALRDPIYAELDAAPAERDERGTDHAMHRRIAIDDLLRDRETALARLRHQGVQTIDLPPEQVVAPVLNRYLALRFGS
ncbi:MAG: DUF58 domain-containing protein [Myxococcota bacterium]